MSDQEPTQAPTHWNPSQSSAVAPPSPPGVGQSESGSLGSEPVVRRPRPPAPAGTRHRAAKSRIVAAAASFAALGAMVGYLGGAGATGTNAGRSSSTTTQGQAQTRADSGSATGVDGSWRGSGSGAEGDAGGSTAGSDSSTNGGHSNGDASNGGTASGGYSSGDASNGAFSRGAVPGGSVAGGTQGSPATTTRGS
jgi:hypothetical protein